MKNIDKKNKLKKLDDEVGKFQPVLQDLFAKIESYNIVNTHGPHENGADFIIEEKAALHTRYIGVVVKIGQIKKDQKSEVERQIDECFTTPRFKPNGTSKINLNEVFVITNSNITNNTKEYLLLNCIIKLN